MVYASHTNNPLVHTHMNQHFIVLTTLLYILIQVAGEDERWSCVGGNILDILLEMQKERERKEEVLKGVLFELHHTLHYVSGSQPYPDTFGGPPHMHTR